MRTRSRNNSTQDDKETDATKEEDDKSSTTSNDSEDSSSLSMEQQSEEEPPPPVSSDDEQEATPSAPSTIKALTNDRGHSNFFAPYRTLGILSNGTGFHLVPHDHSGNAVLCLAVADRFQLLGTERLQPVMVSQRAPGFGRQQVLSVVADASLSITLAVHQAVKPLSGRRHRRSGCSLTLFHRTRPLQRVTLASTTQQEWKCSKLLHLGRIKVPMSGEKLGKLENGVVVAVVLRKVVSDATAINDDDNVPVVGNDDDDSDDDSDNEEEEDNNDELPDDSIDEDALGQVVVLLATRTTLTVQKRIALASLHPFTAAHPSTYVNKIVIGGTNEKGQAAMMLLNIRSKKIIHSFGCLPTTTKQDCKRVTCLTQSPAVDTMAVGTDYGAVHLVNLRLDRLLFSVKNKKSAASVESISFRTDASAFQYRIAPMAVGTADGTITVWDLSPPNDGDDDEEEDETAERTILCEMKHVHIGGIAQLEYLPQEPLLVSTGLISNAVKMHIFDNPDHSGRILRQRAGHAGGPPKVLRYMHPATGGLMPNAADGTDAASSCQLLSAGSIDRTVRLFSTARSVLDKEFGQGLGLEKRAKQLCMSSKHELLLPPVRDMALSQARTRDWGDLVTIHRQHSLAYVWSTKRGSQSGPVLRQPEWNVSARKPPPPSSTHATSVTLSACGNFCVVGTVGGMIYKYNVQSGQPRGSYPRQYDQQQGSGGGKVPGDISRTIRELEKNSEVSNRKASRNRREEDTIQRSRLEKLQRAKLEQASHHGAVTGLAVDAMNKTLLSVGSDSKLILWNFNTHGPYRRSPHMLPAPVSKLAYIRDSDMAAIALEDFAIFLFDCTSLNVVRRLGTKGSGDRHSGPITDLAFSPDGRALYTASMDSTIRMWDVPTNSCVDWMSFDSAPTSLTVSPTGEFLATTHTKSLGVSLWSDRSYYQTIHTDGNHIARPFAMDEPVPLTDQWEASEPVTPSENSTTRGKTTEEDKPRGPVSAKEPGLITLSGLPAAHWKNLFHLELVKERNKPKEPPKKPPSAPFFLQWRSGEEIAGAKKEGLVSLIEKSGEKEEAEWAFAWSDDNENEGSAFGIEEVVKDSKRQLEVAESGVSTRKRPKVTRYRSELATILDSPAGERKTGSVYQAAIDHVAKLGPSAIDVELSSLCAGMHDLEEGLPLLNKACDWLLECCERRDRFEAVNAYLHRFLHLHAAVIAGIKDDSTFAGASGIDDDTKMGIEQSRAQLLEKIGCLRKAQHGADEKLRDKMQHSLCLLRHLTRMV